MPKAYLNYRRLGLECKVHVRSSICGECYLYSYSSTCDMRVTQEE